MSMTGSACAEPTNAAAAMISCAAMIAVRTVQTIIMPQLLSRLWGNVLWELRRIGRLAGVYTDLPGRCLSPLREEPAGCNEVPPELPAVKSWQLCGSAYCTTWS